jgi:hypothetical protein
MSNSKSKTIGDAILWAAAILSSALVDAPVVLTLIILPALAVCSLVLFRKRPGKSEK